MKPWIWLTSAALALTTGCGGGCNNEFGTDTCTAPEDGLATRLEIGSVENGPFTPWSDGAVVLTVLGGQGGTMIPVSLRLSGADVPGCMRQSTRVLRYNNGNLIDSNASAVKTYAQDDGTRTTKSMFMVMSYDTNRGDAVRISVTAASQSADVWVFLDFVGATDAAVPDSGPDAWPGDAGQDAGTDAAMLDAGVDADIQDATADAS